MNNYKVENNTIVILDSTNLTSNLKLQRIALLDEGQVLTTDGSLPPGHHGIYYRVISTFSTSTPIQSTLVDWDGENLSPLEDVARFFVFNKR